jgi:choline dehydrogenase-like flavoprotein
VIFDGEHERRAVDETFDYVIVGSGAAGATAARVLADTGARLAVVEEGPAITTGEFRDQLFPAFRRLYRAMGTQVATGRAAIPVLQGSCLGGTTVVNSAIAWRIPEDVWQSWRSDYGLGEALPLDPLHTHWDQIERELAVRPTAPEVWGENNRLLALGGQRLGLATNPLRRFEASCRGSARCMTGCPFGAKQSMLVSYLPYASERGATLFTSARVERVTWAGGRASGVQGHFHRPQFQKNIAPFTLRARKAVIIAASAIQTPGLLARSGVRSPHLGHHFQGHPGVGLAGVFDAPVVVWAGATQGYESSAQRVTGHYKIETLALPPETLLASLPGVGAAWLANAAELGHMAVWAVALRAEAQGRVRPGPFGTQIRYDLTEADMRALRRGLRQTAELMFAAGARAVLPGIHGLPERLTSPDQARLLEDGPADPACYTFALTHLFGTARMSPSPSAGVVGLDFAVHGRPELYVLDSSIFPTNLGVNPQLGIMGIAMHAAQHIAARTA